MSTAKSHATISKSCEYCNFSTASELSLCTGCNDYFCESHWHKRRAHREKQLGPGGIPHEKVDLNIAEQVEQCLAEPLSDSDEQVQHLADVDTTWFGFDRDANNEPVLAEYRRYAAIMMEHAQDTGRTRHPALVSFIGETGMQKLLAA